MQCPCGSGHPYADCCAPCHDGTRPADTAEALMRSRYSAYVRGDADYLLRTWHSTTRPAELRLTDQPDWERLQVLTCAGGGRDDQEGEVEFVAYYRSGRDSGRLHERSRFVREQAAWFYLDGRPGPAPTPKIGRNSPCPCGSGRKFKQCCGR